MDYLARLWDEITAPPDGPMTYRFYLQSVMSMIPVNRLARRFEKK
jgi:hypothetical protein